MAKILICVPSGDMVATNFCQSLAMLQKRGHECAIAFEVGSLIYDARNKLAKKAIAMGADWTMWFDSDMTFEPDTMLKLLDRGEKFVSGVYYRRNPPYTPVAFKECDVENKHWQDVEMQDQIFSVEGVGFGCVLLSTDVLFDVAAKFGTWFEPFNGYGEDLAFSWRARQCGYDIKLDPAVQCGHVGHMVITEAFHKAYKEGHPDESQS